MTFDPIHFSHVGYAPGLISFQVAYNLRFDPTKTSYRGHAASCFAWARNASQAKKIVEQALRNTYADMESVTFDRTYKREPGRRYGGRYVSEHTNIETGEETPQGLPAPAQSDQALPRMDYSELVEEYTVEEPAHESEEPPSGHDVLLLVGAYIVKRIHAGENLGEAERVARANLGTWQLMPYVQKDMLFQVGRVMVEELASNYILFELSLKDLGKRPERERPVFTDTPAPAPAQASPEPVSYPVIPPMDLDEEPPYSRAQTSEEPPYICSGCPGGWCEGCAPIDPRMLDQAPQSEESAQTSEEPRRESPDERVERLGALYEEQATLDRANTSPWGYYSPESYR